MAKDQSVDKAPLPSFAPSEPVVIPPSELAKAMRQGEEFARELSKRLRKMEQPLDLEYELRRAKQEIEKLQAANREFIGLAKVANRARAYLDWLADPEGTGEQLPKCEEGPEECHLCALQEALDEAGY